MQHEPHTTLLLKSNRRLLQLGGGTLPSSTSTLASELSSKVVSAINAYMSYANLGVSGLTSQSVAVTGMTTASATASISFQFPPSPASPAPLSASAAAANFAAALSTPTILTQISDATAYPLLSQTVEVSNRLNGTNSTLGPQALAFSLNAINIKANPQVLNTGLSAEVLTFNTPVYTASVDFALSGSSDDVAQIIIEIQLHQATSGALYDQLTSFLMSYQVVPDPTADPDIIANTLYPVTTLNSSVSPVLSAFNELQGVYYIALLDIPTQAGGINYTVNLTAWEISSTPIFSQQLFIVGPLAAPALIGACQSSLYSMQLAYLPSTANGLNSIRGNINMTHQPIISLLPPQTTNAASAITSVSIPVPPAAISATTTPSWCMQALNLVTPCADGYCPPPTAYMNVDITAIPALASSLNLTGNAQYWNFSMQAQRERMIGGG